MGIQLARVQSPRRRGRSWLGTTGGDMVLRHCPTLSKLSGWVFGCLATLAAASAAQAQLLPAFPGADGAGASATGGRGGIVYHVTLLDKNFSDTAEGTLRYGLSDGNFTVQGVVQPRTIVFDVAGTFWLGRYGEERGHDNGWDTQSRLNLGSHVTIAGQTAPGPVNIMGGVVKANGENVVLRNVTIAPGYGLRSFAKPDENPPVLPTPGDFPDSYVYDAIDISGQNLIVDHVTTAYATDETISMNEFADDVTVQYSSISQAQNYPQADAEGGGRFTGHALGSLIQPGSNANVSVHHNLYAHQKGRLPRVGTESGALTTPGVGAYNDFRNNVFYNWLGTAGGDASGQASQNNFVGNFYLAGPGGDDPVGGTNPGVTTRAGGTGIFSRGSSLTKLYASGNLRDINKDGDALDVSTASFSTTTSVEFTQTPYYGVTDSATTAYERVLDYMGANWWDRSDLDSRIVAEVRSGTGKIMAWADDPFNDDPSEGVEWRNMLALRANPSTGAAPFARDVNWDSDGDGMPNAWEKAHGLPTDLANNNGDFDADGYTDLEEYLNDLAAWPAPKPLEFVGGVDSRYARTENWDIPWQPSRFDEVRLGAGEAIVDAVGQHARRIVIGTTGAPQSRLQITGGWLRVEEDVAIGGGDQDVAELSLAGGELFVPVLRRAAGGLFQMTGGTLHADAVDFSLTLQGGVLAPGGLLAESSIGETIVMGDLDLGAATLQIEIGGDDPGVTYDVVGVSGAASLASATLSVELAEGYVPVPSDEFGLLMALGGLNGSQFAALQLPALTEGAWALQYLTDGAVLSVVGDSGLLGDFNGDGQVNAADLATWEAAFGLSAAGDADGDFDTDGADFLIWQRQQGSTLVIPAGAAIPEPAAAWLALAALMGVSRRRRR
ncbi:MAG: hypothetical protein KDA61_15175 [Planctomycetales bacterium]|nr:hypothetical protein [Planctomycetales bacterium]